MISAILDNVTSDDYLLADSGRAIASNQHVTLLSADTN